MATYLAVPVAAEQERGGENGSRRGLEAGFVTALTAVALLLHGYHPYAEDGGLYLAGVKRLLRPELYPKQSEFVTEHLRFSCFAPLVAGLVRSLHVDLMTVVLVLHVASYWFTLFAAWELAKRCFKSVEARCGAVVLLAVWLAIPVAGTSLLLMDPYVSARSISTPSSLLALVGVLDFMAAGQAGGIDSRRRRRGLVLGCLALVVAALVHPLMAGYALGFVLLVACAMAESRAVRWGGTAGLCAVAVGAAAVLHGTAAAESAEYLRVVMTRSYWFVGEWRWYEQFGLVGPLVILGVAGWARRDSVVGGLARAGVAAGALAVVVAGLFARAGSTTHLVARLQPLRMFQMVYVVMILMVGAAWAEWVLKRRVVRWGLTLAVLGGVMFMAGRMTFPNSAQWELPWTTPRNGWKQAFVWVSRNTPVDALFAIDARYIDEPGEDAQTFRAIAERSVLPDAAKDGGEASITPDLTAAWTLGQAAQTGLNGKTDAERVALLKPLGVSWLVLRRDAATGFACDYEGAVAKVCRLP